MENSSLIYRKATIDDLELLALTRVEFICVNHKDLTDAEKSALYETNKAYFAETLKDGTFAAFLVFDGEKLAATSGVSFFTMPPHRKNVTGKTAYISNMYTKPEYRGKGIATRLFEMLMEEAQKRGCGKAMLYATEMGRPIYEKYGFFAVDNAMDYYFNTK